MMSANKVTCAGRTRGRWDNYPCTHKGALEYCGKMYCKIHHPPTVEAKRKERDRIYTEKYEARQAKDNAAKNARAEIERKAGCYDDLLAALEALRLQAWQSTVSDPSNEWGQEALEMANAAIAKAKGEQP